MGDRNLAQLKQYYNLCNERLRSIDFPDEFRDCCGHYCRHKSHRRILDKFYDRVVNILSEAARKSSGRRKRRRKGLTVGWNDLVKKAHKEATCSFLAWRSNGRPPNGELFEKMNSDKKVFKGRLKFCIKNKEQLLMDKIASKHKEKDFKSFWKLTGTLNSKPKLPVCVNGVNGDNNIAKLFMDHFKVSPLPIPPQKDTVCSDQMCNAEPDCATNFVRFSATEVKNTIARMKGGKSPGHDGLTIEHLVHAGPHLPNVLATFYTLCVGHAYLPSKLMRTTVVPIIKNKTGDVSDKNNYRPISLATIAAKVLDSLLDSHLDKALHLHDAQFGFRTGVSTESAIFSLKHTVRYYTDRKTPVYACFLDLSKAFDRVSYQLLWSKLEKVLPPEIVNLFKYWYSNQLNSVRWSKGVSEMYRLECGVRQGGLTSPKLFNLYMNQLIVELSNTYAGCSIDGTMVNNISYADDMVLLCPSICGLRDLLKICENYALRHGMQYNDKKSELMLVTGGKNKPPQTVPPVFLNGNKLNIVKQFRYLGHIITNDLKDDCDIERERRALAVRGNMVARRFARCSIPVKISLFKAFCQCFYTSSLWVNYTQKSLNTLRVQYNNIFRMLLGLPRFCSASEMFANTFTDGFTAIMRKRVASIMSRVRGSNNSILKTISNKYDCPLLHHWVKLLVA